jgi:glycosyltransferase involved in cell wall biosynthesis
VLWCTRPTPAAVRLAAALPSAPLVYELMDAIPATHPRASTLATAEAALLGRAGAVVCTAEQLCAHVRGRGAAPQLVPNGVDLAHFGGAGSPLPAAARALGPGPVVGWYGTVGDWVDLPLLATLADGFPAVQFVLIGPVEVPRSRLPRRPNLSWVGPRPYAELPGWLEAFTVCLLPFRVNEFTRAVNPVKLYEYLAAGKPIVSTLLPEVLPFADLVYIGADTTGLAAALAAALAEGARPDLAARRRRAAAANTWEQRVDQLVHLLHRLLPP